MLVVETLSSRNIKVVDSRNSAFVVSFVIEDASLRIGTLKDACGAINWRVCRSKLAVLNSWHNREERIVEWLPAYWPLLL